MTIDTNYNSNQWADYWRYKIGVNVLPANSNEKRPLVKWSQYQKKPITEDQHENWKKYNLFANGISILPGKVWHQEDRKGLYLIHLDADRKTAIDELCSTNGKQMTLKGMSHKFIVEQHDDNPEKAHIYFYSPIPFPKKDSDPVLGLEVKGLGEHGVANCSGSVHKNGKPWNIIGTRDPVVLTAQQAQQLMQHINQICLRYGLSYLDKRPTSKSSPNISTKLRAMIKRLSIDPTVKIISGERHNTLISVADSLLFKHSAKESEDHLRKFFEKINNILCDPEPLPASEIESIWNSALRFVEEIRNEQQQQYSAVATHAWTQKNDSVTSTKRSVLSDISKVLGDTDLYTKFIEDVIYWTVISENPYKFIGVSKKRGCICRISISHSDSSDKNSVTKKAHLNYGTVIIRLVPKNIVMHETPLKFLETAPQYTITFEDQNHKQFMVTGSTDTIVDILKEKQGYVVSAYGVAEALMSIIGAFSDDGKLIIDESVSFEGYYYHNGDIQISKIDFDKKHPVRSKEECLSCAQYLEKRSEFQIWNYKGRQIDRRDLLASAIKWTIAAPFNFALKQLNCKPYLKGFDMTGERDGGKTGLSEEILNMHGNPTNEQDPDTIYSMSAGSMNTEAKFGKGVSKTTYPIEISEFGNVESYGRNEDLVEIVKTAIDGLIVRRGRDHLTGRYDAPFSSCSPLIFNGNPFFSHKGEILKRFHVNTFSEEDRHDRSPNSAFNLFQGQNKYKLKILGDWTMRYIYENRHELLLSKKYNPYEVSRIALERFYEFAGVKVPEWLTWWSTDTALDELDLDEKSLIRAILYNHVHKTLRDNSKILEIDNLGEINVSQRISLCVEHDLWPWIRKAALGSAEARAGEFDIDTSIMELFSYRLPNLPFKKLSEIMEFAYSVDRGGRKRIKCTKKQLEDFIISRAVEKQAKLEA